MDKFLSSNETSMRLARTIVQGLLSVIVTFLPDIIAGTELIPATYKPMVVATCMAILSPIMAVFGDEDGEDITDE